MPWFDHAAGEPTPDSVKASWPNCVADFEFFESPKARARRVDEEIRHYTEEQFRALDNMRRMPRVVFDGPAGTGKTLLALEAARRSHAAGKSVLFLCFNRPLCEWLQDQAAELLDAGRTPTVTIRTVHQYMTDLAGRSAKGSPKDRAAYWDRALPEAATERLLENWDALKLAEKDNPSVADYRADVRHLRRADRRRGSGRRSRLLPRRARPQRPWRACPRAHGECSAISLGRPSTTTPSRWRGSARPGAATARRSRWTRTAATRPGWRSWRAARVHVAPGYSRILRPDDGVVPQVHFFADDDIAARKRLTRVLEELYEAGFTGPQVAVLSPHADKRAAATSLTEQPWRDRLEPLMEDREHATFVESAHRQDALQQHLPVQGPRGARRRAHRHRRPLDCARSFARVRGGDARDASACGARARVASRERCG